MAGRRGSAAPATSSSSTATTSASTSSSPTRPAAALRAPRGQGASSSPAAQDRVFCAGRQHLHARAESTHAFKVNFCKYTNETRLASRTPAQLGLKLRSRVNGGLRRRRLRARARVRRDPPRRRRQLRGVAARGAAARRAARHRRPHAPRRQAQGAPRPRRRVLHDGRRACAASAPSTGASSTRLVPKRSQFDEKVRARAKELAAASCRPRRPRGRARRRHAEVDGDNLRYRTCARDRRAARTATLTSGPTGPARPPPLTRAGVGWWALRAFRELDDALLQLRFDHSRSA
jgi:benzoyl-CoA-dihydrodiol lyase